MIVPKMGQLQEEIRLEVQADMQEVIEMQEKEMIYENILALCQTHGTTIGALEKELGFGCSTISSWKKGCPSAKKLKMVADRFDVPMELLMGEADAHTIAGRLLVFDSGEAICGDSFGGLWELLKLLSVFGKGKKIEVRVYGE